MRALIALLILFTGLRLVFAIFENAEKSVGMEP